MKKKIILDTNFLLIPGQFHVDIFEEARRISDFSYSIFVLDKTISELEKLAKTGKVRQRDAARIGLKLIDAKGIKVIRTEEGSYADDLLVMQKGSIVATVDRQLQKRLKEEGITVITLRQKKYLKFV